MVLIKRYVISIGSVIKILYRLTPFSEIVP